MSRRGTAPGRRVARLLVGISAALAVGCSWILDLGEAPGRGDATADAVAPQSDGASVRDDATIPPDARPDDVGCDDFELDCSDGRDDDCDGQIDCADEDCAAVACDDGDDCTYNDACLDTGICRGVEVTCPTDPADGCGRWMCRGRPTCELEPVDGGCDDQDPCTYDDQCTDGRCVGRLVECASDACVTRGCDGTTTCIEQVRPGAPCGEGDDPCVAARCDDLGRCVEAINVGAACADDDNPCTEDRCDAEGRCVHVPREGAPCGEGEVECRSSTCNALGACETRALVGEPCSDDGNVCTDDVCDDVGACVHRPVGFRACADDGNPCTYDLCDGEGRCVHPAVEDGLQCGDARAVACCGGACVDQRVDPNHCGGCGITCDGLGCTAFAGSGVCRCDSNARCREHGPTWTCYDDGRGLECNCQSDADCPGAMVCALPSGTNYCRHP